MGPDWWFWFLLILLQFVWCLRCLIWISFYFEWVLHANFVFSIKFTLLYIIHGAKLGLSSYKRYRIYGFCVIMIWNKIKKGTGGNFLIDARKWYTLLHFLAIFPTVGYITLRGRLIFIWNWSVFVFYLFYLVFC